MVEQDLCLTFDNGVPAVMKSDLLHPLPVCFLPGVLILTQRSELALSKSGKSNRTTVPSGKART